MENIKDIFFDINFINDVIDGLVDDVTAAEFFEHINECENCRRVYVPPFLLTVLVPMASVPEEKRICACS